MIIETANVGYYHPTDDHRPIAEAVLAGDYEAAAAAMKKHAIANGESLMKTERLFREKNRPSSRRFSRHHPRRPCKVIAPNSSAR